MGFGWYLSSVLIYAFGALGTLFTLKEFGDPDFSDWISPGPGQPLLGDSGRMLMFEAGPDGIQSKLLGGTAYMIEGVILGLGSLGVLLCVFTSQKAQLVSAFFIPLEGFYYLSNVVYFYLCNSPEMISPMVIMGGGLIALSYVRFNDTRPSRATLHFYNQYLWFLTILLFVTSGMIYYKATKIYTVELSLFIKVRDHFLENGMTWSAGLPFPDGFDALPKTACPWWKFWAR